MEENKMEKQTATAANLRTPNGNIVPAPGTIINVNAGHISPSPTVGRSAVSVASASPRRNVSFAAPPRVPVPVPNVRQSPNAQHHTAAAHILPNIHRSAPATGLRQPHEHTPTLTQTQTQTHIARSHGNARGHAYDDADDVVHEAHLTPPNHSPLLTSMAQPLSTEALAQEMVDDGHHDEAPSSTMAVHKELFMHLSTPRNSLNVVSPSMGSASTMINKPSTPSSTSSLAATTGGTNPINIDDNNEFIAATGATGRSVNGNNDDDNLASPDGLISVAYLKHRLIESGIPLTDPRLAGVMERCENAPDFVDFDTFRYLIDPAILLSERALYQRLAVPRWAEFTAHLDHIFVDAAQSCHHGDLARYIPELAHVNPDLWGMSFCSIDGQQHNAGDTKHAFSVQSVGKPLTYLIALENCGEKVVHRFVGREPSGRAFNELSLNHEMIPHNPLINSGSIMLCSLIQHQQSDATRFNFIMDYWRRCAPNHPPSFNNTIYLSERATANRNFALGYMMQEKGAFQSGRDKKKSRRPWGATDMVKALEIYFMTCSIEANCQAIACVAATLANGGVSPITGERIFAAKHVRSALSLMLSCGLYDYSGEWAYTVGLPAKSGVSGILMVVIPNIGGFALFSPRLDLLGNSARGIEFVKLFNKRFSFHYLDFASNDDPDAACYPTTQRNYRDPIVALCSCCATGDLGGVKGLVASGADLNATDYDNRTPLHVACAEGHMHIVRYLLAKKVNVNSYDRFHHTPLSEALAAGFDDVVELLKLHGALHASQQSPAIPTISLSSSSNGVIGATQTASASSSSLSSSSSCSSSTAAATPSVTVDAAPPTSTVPTTNSAPTAINDQSAIPQSSSLLLPSIQSPSQTLTGPTVSPPSDRSLAISSTQSSPVVAPNDR